MIRFDTFADKITISFLNPNSAVKDGNCILEYEYKNSSVTVKINIQDKTQDISASLEDGVEAISMPFVTYLIDNNNFLESVEFNMILNYIDKKPVNNALFSKLSLLKINGVSPISQIVLTPLLMNY